MANKLKLLGLKTWAEIVTLAADRTAWRMGTTNMHHKSPLKEKWVTIMMANSNRYIYV